MVPVSTGVSRQLRKQIQPDLSECLWVRVLEMLKDACSTWVSKIFLQGDSTPSLTKVEIHCLNTFRPEVPS